MAKDGSYYWVFTHITPDFDLQRNIVGYTSVRRYPRREAVVEIERVYREMLQAEQRAGARDAITAGTGVLLELLKQRGVSYEELIFSL